MTTVKNSNMNRKEYLTNDSDPTPFMDLLRQQTLLDYMLENDETAEFTYTSGGIRLAGDKESIISEWSPGELEAALNALVRADKLVVFGGWFACERGEAPIWAYFTGRHDDHRVNLPLPPPLRLVSLGDSFGFEFTWNTVDDTIPAEKIYELIMTDSCFVGRALIRLYEAQMAPGSVAGFDDSDTALVEIAKKLSRQEGDLFLTDEELAICREPVEGGIPRLGKYRRQIRRFMDDDMWMRSWADELKK
jgi:hypothetical protein